MAGKQAIDIVDEIKKLREELGIKETPSKAEEKVQSEIKKAREISLGELREVAEGQRLEDKNGAINAVTSPEEEKTQEGQTHDDE